LIYRALTLLLCCVCSFNMNSWEGNAFLRCEFYLLTAVVPNLLTSTSLSGTVCYLSLTRRSIQFSIII
jgi:hypothetical protein